MTREEAIRILTTKRGMPSTDYNYAEALSLAIEALEQKIKIDNRVKNELNRVKTELEPCEDWDEVLNELNRIGRNAFKDDTDYDSLFNFISGLPSVKQEPRTGHWIYHRDWDEDGGCPYECSECGKAYDYRMNYCGYCGIKMEV